MLDPVFYCSMSYLATLDCSKMSAGPKLSSLVCLTLIVCLLHAVIAQRSGIAPSGYFDSVNPITVSPGNGYYINWVGGDGVSTIIITLMQGPDYNHLTTIQVIARM